MSETKQVSDGIIIGRAFNKLQAINDAETVELTQSPGQIRDKYEARRQKVLTDLEPGIREKVERLLAE